MDSMAAFKSSSIKHDVHLVNYDQASRHRQNSQYVTHRLHALVQIW